MRAAVGAAILVVPPDEGTLRDHLAGEVATLLATVAARVRPHLFTDPGDDSLWAVREATTGLCHLVSGDAERLGRAVGHLERAGGHAR